MESDPTRENEAIMNLFKLAQGLFDMRSFTKAGKIYKLLLNNHLKLVKHLTID